MSDDFVEAGTGLTVYQDDTAVEGPMVWLDSPSEVIAFVNSGRAAESIVLARGGTTTFLTPALTAGVKGIMTLNGAPESHLGILSREYGIPCLMSVKFTDGTTTSRGETIPKLGATVRLDISTAPKGTVYVVPGTGEDAADSGEAAPGMPEEMAKQVEILLANYGGEVPHGTEGDEQYRKHVTTGVLELDPSTLDRDLERPEVNELLDYMGWNFWDFLSARATEGESGLIPRQEYEAVGCVQIWQRYPEMFRFITEAVGVDGVREIGATPRREPANKANMLHTWCTGFTPAFGRGLLAGMGMAELGDREDDLRAVLQFMRRLYAGLWDDGGGMFTSMRGYRGPILHADWITRFRDDVVALDDPERRSFMQRFSASTELMGFLLHFDNRSGLADTGPYPLDDGGFLLVRDHFLYDPVYHWADVAEGLPHAITQAMVFRPDSPLELALMDGATLFTKPGNYLKHLRGMAVYARDRWDTPASEIRRLEDAEIDAVQAHCDRATSALYKRIASMPKRDKVWAGAQVYYTEFVAPFARAAGVWDRLQSEFDFFEVDPVASEAYYKLVTDGVAATVVPQLFLTGQGFPAVPDGAAGPDLPDGALDTLHALALRGMAGEVPGDPAPLVDAGLIGSTPAGYLLTDEGRAAHDRLLDEERAGLDVDELAKHYERFLAANPAMKSVCARHQSADEDARFALHEEAGELIDRVEPALGRTAQLVARFDGYVPRMRTALEAAEAGAPEQLTSPKVDSVHTVWMECHEDYLQTLGRSREEEGSY